MPRRWPVIVLAAIAARTLASWQLNPAAGVLVLVTFAEAAGIAVIARRSGLRTSLERLRDVLLLITAAAFVSACCMLVGGPLALVLGLTPSGSVGSAMIAYGFGTFIGIVVLAPAVITWKGARLGVPKPGRVLEYAILMALTVAASAFGFGWSGSIGPDPFAARYVVVPLFLWCALRFRPRGVAALVLVTSLVSTALTVYGYGPVVEGSFSVRLSLLTTYLAIGALSSLVLASAVTERRRAQADFRVANQALIASGNRLELALEAGRITTWDIDAATGTLHWNEASQDEVGDDTRITKGEAWETVLPIVHPDDRADVAAAIARSLRDGTPLNTTFRFLRPEGGVVWLECRGTVERDRSGRIIGVAGTAIDLTDRIEIETELAHRATHDQLTDLPNRELFIVRLETALGRLSEGRWLAVLFCDLDRFKVVNDSLGHGMGDEVLRVAAFRIGGTLRPDDTVARLGGDEFAILLPDMADPSDARQVARRLQAALAPPVLVEDQEVFTSASVGIAVTGSHDEAPETLLRHADTAMYRAKTMGRDCHVVFDDALRSEVAARLHTENALRHAIENDELTVHYQPQVDLGTGAVAGFEALVRWNHPDQGLLQAARFIEIAEESGLIVPLGTWALAHVCRQTHEWRKRDVGRGREWWVAVNLATRQLAEPGLVDRLAVLLATEGLEPNQLCLEITETSLMYDPDASLATLRRIHDLGVRLAVDDFGTGYAALSYLKHFPLDQLKIDKSFVAGLGDNPADTAIVAAVIALGHRLDLTVIAEGVESEAQVDALAELGCDLVQGFHFAHAEPPERAVALLASNVTAVRRRQGPFSAAAGDPTWS